MVITIDQETRANNINASILYAKSLKQSSLISCLLKIGCPWLAHHAAVGPKTLENFHMNSLQFVLE
jgi:hypothetical protein